MDGPYHDYNEGCACGYCKAMRTVPPPPAPRRLTVPAGALAHITASVNGGFECLAQAAQLLTPAHEEDPRAIVAALRALYGHLESVLATVEIIVEENHGS